MHSLEVIKFMNSPEQTSKRGGSVETRIRNQQLKKYGGGDNKTVQIETEQLNIQVSDLKTELENTKNKLDSIRNKYRKSLVSRLEKIENSNNTLPIGTEMKICDTDYDNPQVEGKIEHETKKFYVIGGKRYHKYGLKFFGMDEGTVVLENTKW